jgi:hypothetical protein
MHRDLRLILLKRLVNIPLRIVDRLLPEPKPARYPQTKMLNGMYVRMLKVYCLDCFQGTFGAKPDGNFHRLLKVGWKVLARICEDDPYYRKWVGLAVLLAADALVKLDKDPEVLKRQVKEMWHMNLDNLSNEFAAEFAEDLAELVMCDYLGNLARLEVGGPASLDQTKTYWRRKEDLSSPVLEETLASTKTAS